jgi:hypothetical protein
MPRHNSKQIVTRYALFESALATPLIAGLAGCRSSGATSVEQATGGHRPDRDSARQGLGPTARVRVAPRVSPKPA